MIWFLAFFIALMEFRIEVEEVEFIDKLRKNLSGNTIPILYVYTQAVRQSAINGMKE